MGRAVFAATAFVAARIGLHFVAWQSRYEGYGVRDSFTVPIQSVVLAVILALCVIRLGLAVRVKWKSAIIVVLTSGGLGAVLSIATSFFSGEPARLVLISAMFSAIEWTLCGVVAATCLHLSLFRGGGVGPTKESSRN